MEFSDVELVSEIRAGSAVAFEQLMRRYRRLVYHVAYGFTKDRESAMEITQETFVKVYGKFDRFDTAGNLKNWIARIAANEAISLLRRAGRRPTAPLEEDAFAAHEPSQQERLERLESHAALHESLATLSPRQRLAVVLRYFEGMSPRDIAAVLECRESTARNILFRSLQKLRTILCPSEERPS